MKNLHAPDASAQPEEHMATDDPSRSLNTVREVPGLYGKCREPLRQPWQPMALATDPGFCSPVQKTGASCYARGDPIAREGCYSAPPALERDIEQLLSVRITVKGVGAQVLPCEHRTLLQAFRSALGMLEDALELLRWPWDRGAQHLMQAYFGREIAMSSPAFGRIRECLLGNLETTRCRLRRYVAQEGMHRVGLFEYLPGQARQTVAIVNSDDRYGYIFIDRHKLPPMTSELAFQTVLLHEVSHFSKAKDDFWYVNQTGFFDASKTLESIGQARWYSDRLLNGRFALLSEHAVAEIFRLALSGRRRLRRWAREVLDNLDCDPRQADRQRAEKARELFSREPEVRCALAVNNADSLAFAVVEIALYVQGQRGWEGKH